MRRSWPLRLPRARDSTPCAPNWRARWQVCRSAARPRFHAGTAEVGARVVARDVDPDAPFAARIVLDQPVVLRAGDRFVLRTSAPLNTVAGGVVTDPYAPARARPWPAGSSADARL